MSSIDLLHVRVERESDNPFASNYYYDLTPRFLRFRAVPRGSGWAVLNELLTSELGRRSIPTRPVAGTSRSAAASTSANFCLLAAARRFGAL